MKKSFERTAMLLGNAAMEKLAEKHVAVFGIGGVGGYVTEALARAGIGSFTLIDNDTVSESNLNRQIIATNDTIGRRKTEVMAERIHSICPDTKVTVRNCFFLPENAGEIDFTAFDYVVDAVDTVTAKIEIIVRAREAKVPVISCMGTGNKLDPSKLEIEKLEKTSVCPLAKVMRRELKKRGITGLKVLYSKEEPRKPLYEETDAFAPTGQEEESFGNRKRSVPGSISFVPSAAGLLIAAEVVKDFLENRE